MKRTTTETALNRSGFIEDAVTVQEENREGVKNHPHFIEANTSGITLRELTEKNIIPTNGKTYLILFAAPSYSDHYLSSL